jgi:hypothetical protein
MPVSIPVGYESGCHTLVLGATGAGKTFSETWVACRLIEAGHGAIAIDPKGDQTLRSELQAATQRVGVRFEDYHPRRGAAPRDHPRQPPAGGAGVGWLVSTRLWHSPDCPHALQLAGDPITLKSHQELSELLLINLGDLWVVKRSF